MYPGKPCQFVDIGVGCTIYKNRPKDPCKTFMCMWRADMRMPEHFKPSEINALVSQQEINGIPFLSAVETGSKMDSEFVSWFVSHVVANKINAEWHIEDKSFFIGDGNFGKAMNEKYEQQRIAKLQISTAENSAE